MGWKGTLRTLQAASRQAERNAQRRQRELEKRRKEYAKMEALEQAAYEVEVYDNYIEVLLSVHRECSEQVDWASYLTRPEPGEPERNATAELKAQSRLEGYQPGFFARLFGMQQRQITSLQKAVDKGRSEDSIRFAKAIEAWQIEHSEWQSDYALAQRLLRGEGQAKLDAIKLLNPFEDISMLGASVKFVIQEGGLVEAFLGVHGDRVIPAESKSLLQSGKLSTKKLPTGKYNELLQDYVCSCVLRVGRELLAILPDDLVIVTATDRLLNTTSGHLEELPLLSVAISRRTLESLNLDAIDPSDSMRNFAHNMSFKKTAGFAPVKALLAKDFLSATL